MEHFSNEQFCPLPHLASIDGRTKVKVKVKETKQGPMMVLSDSSDESDFSSDDDSALFRPVFSRHQRAASSTAAPGAAPGAASGAASGAAAAAEKASSSLGPSPSATGGAHVNVNNVKGKGGKMRRAMAMRRRLVIDDDDDTSSNSGSSEEEDCDDDDNSHKNNSDNTSDAAHDAMSSDNAMASGSSSATLNLTLGTPGILRPASLGPIGGGGGGPAAARTNHDANMGANGDGNDDNDRGLIAALESLALSPVVPNGVVGTPMIGMTRTTIGADVVGTTTTPATPAATTSSTPAAPPGGAPLDASVAEAKANDTTTPPAAALHKEDSDQNDDDDVGEDNLADTDDAIGEGQKDEVTTPVPVQMPAAELDDAATTNCNGTKSSNSMAPTPAQRRLDNIRRRFNGGGNNNNNKRTPLALRLEDLNYEESDHDDECSGVEEEDDDETESEADDDIFQTSYYVPSGRKLKKEAASAGGSSSDGRNEDVVTKPREPAQLLVDTDDDRDDESEANDDDVGDASYSTSSSSSSGITISDDEEKVGNAGTDEIENLFRDGLKISSSPTTPDDDDDDSSKSVSSEEVPALILSPLEPSPNRVDMTSLSDEDGKTSSDEPADSAWTHDAETDEYYLSSGGVNGHTWPNLRLPTELYRRLYPHQKVGVQWMASMHRGGVGGILGDDMGLGKVCVYMDSLRIFAIAYFVGASAYSLTIIYFHQLQLQPFLPPRPSKPSPTSVG